MKIMSRKQYEKTLDEEFTIRGKKFQVGLFPSGWQIYSVDGDNIICSGKSSKKLAIETLERLIDGKYDSKNTKFI
jgi:hypothetical protein